MPGSKEQPQKPEPEQESNEALFGNVNQELYKRNAELAVRNKTLALLRKLDGISMATIDLRDMAQQIARAIALELGYEIVSVSIVERSAGQPDTAAMLHLIAAASSVPQLQKVLDPYAADSLEVSLSADLAGPRALREKKMQLASRITDVYVAPLVTAVRRTTAIPELTSFIVYPLFIDSRPLGAVTIGATRDLHNLTTYEQESLDGISGLVSLALYKAMIYQDLEDTTKKLTVANEQLAQLDKAKSEFLSIASHQLYTPLTALKGYLSMVQEGDYGPVASKQLPVMNILRESSDRLIDLIRNLLDVSRIESGRLELSLESIDLAGMARDLVKELTPNAQRRKLTLTFEESADALPHVVADTQRLRQVLLNTVDNAIKYTDTGRIQVRVVQDGATLVFSVQDTGKGIAPEEMNRLFTKFTRVGGSDRYHTEGSGLGLYVARQIVREHRGDIWVESPGIGKGSTFFVRLPVEDSPESLKAGTKLIVGIKAAEVGQQANGTQPKTEERPAKPAPRKLEEQ
ncbi:MAG: multi-sensor hybrid histidine kinase [Parcubacteria group bacterium Gr01-1014_106]|nr:MAG: multi-sensor hybrid histidine kinase [Parcubacteria group bacterium Gr01-1014_106]